MIQEITFLEICMFIQQWEGCRDESYKDTTGNWTIGIGHYLGKGNALQGTKWNKGKIDAQFKIDVFHALTSTSGLFPQFTKYPKEVQLILVDLSFNLGMVGLSKFKNFRTAILAQDYQAAAKALENSKWYKQVGKRGKHHVQVLKGL